MNTTSLNNLWTYLQGLTLTTSNKKWLADHLYEAVRQENLSSVSKVESLSAARAIRKEKERRIWEDIQKVKKEDLIFSQEVFDIVKDIEPMPEDVDVDRIKNTHIMQKYG